jgi:cytoskeletal protein CcmA (bactofilin family)
VRLATAGKLEVAKNAHVVAEVRVNELVVDGVVKGPVTATDRVSVSKKGQIIGDVVCRRLSVEPGAKLDGRFAVGPDLLPPTPEKPVVDEAEPVRKREEEAWPG